MKYRNKKSLLIVISLILAFVSGCSQNYRHVPQRQSSAQPAVQNQQHIPTSSQHHSASQPAAPHTQHQPTSSSYQTRNRIVQLANSTLGTRYRYGGSNPQRGFDCSGLMVYIHKQSGIKIPRTAAKQRIHSRTITYAQLQPGDMLFFKTGKRTDHVGIYIGDRKFIHASTGSRRVRVAKMDSAYWHKRFVKFGTYL